MLYLSHKHMFLFFHHLVCLNYCNYALSRLFDQCFQNWFGLAHFHKSPKVNSFDTDFFKPLLPLIFFSFMFIFFSLHDALYLFSTTVRYVFLNIKAFHLNSQTTGIHVTKLKFFFFQFLPNFPLRSKIV